MTIDQELMPELVNSIPASDRAAQEAQALPFDFKEVEQKLANINEQINLMMGDNSATAPAKEAEMTVPEVVVE